MPAAPDITVQVIGVKGCELKGKGSVQVVVNNMTGITRVSEGSELSFNQTFAFKRAEIIRLLVFNREGTVCYYVDAKLDKVLNSGTCWLPLTGEVSGGQIGIVVSTIKGDVSAPAAIPTSSSNNVSFSLPKTDSQSIPLPPESHTNTIHTPSLESHSSKPTTPNSRPTQPQQSPPHIDLPPPITHQTNVSTVSSVPLPTSTSPSSPRPSPRPSVPTTTTTTTTTTTVVESPIATNLLPTDNSTLTLYTTSLRYNLQEYNACNRLKHILTAKNVPFVDIDVANEGNRSRWDQAKHSAQSKSIPLIFVGPKFVSTFDNFEQWNEEGTLYKHLTELGYTGPSPSSHENNAMASSSYSLAVPSIPAIQDPRFRTYQEYGFEPNSPPSQYMTSPTYNYVQPSSPQSMTRIAMPMPMEYPSPYHQLSPPSRFYPESPPLIPSSSSPRPISRSDAMVPYSTPNLAAIDYSYPAVSTPYASTYELASPMADPSQTCRPVQHMGISSYQHNNLPEPHVYDSLVWVTALARGDWFYIWNSERTMKKAYWVWVESQRGLLCWSGSDLATNIEDPSHAVIWMPLQECFNVLSAPTVDGSGEVNYNTLVVFSSYHLLLTTSKHLKFALWFYGLCQLTERARRSNANLDAYLSSADPAISWADWRGGPHMIR